MLGAIEKQNLLHNRTPPSYFTVPAPMGHQTYLFVGVACRVCEGLRRNPHEYTSKVHIHDLETGKDWWQR